MARVLVPVLAGVVVVLVLTQTGQSAGPLTPRAWLPVTQAEASGAMATPVPQATPSPTPSAFRPLLTNGNFEGGTLGWAGCPNCISDWSQCFNPTPTRRQCAFTGGMPEAAVYLYQRVVIPATARYAFFSLTYAYATEEVRPDLSRDDARIGIGTFPGYGMGYEIRRTPGDGSHGWRFASMDVSEFRGRLVELYVWAYTDSVLSSVLYVDDVDLSYSE